MAPSKKKSTKKTSTKRKSAPKKTQPETAVRGAHAEKLAEYNEQGEQIVKLIKSGKTPAEVAEVMTKKTKAPFSVGKVKRLQVRSTLRPKDRIGHLPPEELGKEIARLRDEEGLPWAPDIWARTGGMGAGQMRLLYEEATGRPWQESGKPKEDGTKATKKSSTKKGSAKKTSGKKKTSTKRKKSSGRPSMLARIQDDATSDEDVAEILDGRTITVGRSRGTGSDKYDVKKIRKIGPAKTGGRAVAFVDVDQKDHVINLRAITGVK